jgi:flagellar hook-associated protein 2
MTFADVAKKLQDLTAGKTTELRASFDDTTSRFFISTKGMGANQNFSLEFSSPVLASKVLGQGSLGPFSTSSSTAAAYTTTATYGEVEFDGITVANLTSNKTTINGLTLNLMQVRTSPTPTIITVQSDTTK